jgi:hypothetical protein
MPSITRAADEATGSRGAEHGPVPCPFEAFQHVFPFLGPLSARRGVPWQPGGITDRQGLRGFCQERAAEVKTYQERSERPTRMG